MIFIKQCDNQFFSGTNGEIQANTHESNFVKDGKNETSKTETDNPEKLIQKDTNKEV